MNYSRFWLACLLSVANASMSMAHEFHLGTLDIQHPWSRPTAEGMPMGVAYFVIVNRGKTPDTLLSASSPACDSVEFHRTLIQDGMARMRPAGEIVIAPGATVKAEPEGLHLMLVGLKEPLVAGSLVPLTLRFKTAGEVTVKLKIEANSVSEAAHGADSHAH